MEWRSRVTDLSPEPSVAEVAAPYDQLPRLIRQVLQSRGLFTKERVGDWLSPKLKDLRDPSCLRDMARATQRLLEAFEKKQTVCVYADFDLDGTSGLALLKCGLEQLGFPHVQYYQPRRLSEGYGVHPEAIERIAERGDDLVVTVDVGITAFEAAERARALGLDLIITDHHLPKETLPCAYAVVNPNQTACESELGHLSGAGVAFYLLLSVKRALAQNGWLKSDVDLKELLDFYVIGTLTDLVPLVEENRVLVKHGLVQLARTKRPGLRALLNALEMSDRPLGSSDVAIKFAPKLNALSRMDQGILPIDIFLEESQTQADALVKKVLATNQVRQQLQAMAEKDAFVQAEAQMGQGFFWVYSKEYHKGIIGLVATKLAKTFHRPAFVGSCSEDGVISGSSRAPDGGQHNLTKILAAAGDVLNRFGGHAAAAGFELDEVHASHFAEKIGHFMKAHPPQAQPPKLYDAEGVLGDIDESFLSWFDHLEPFGSEFQIPLFLLRRLQLKELKVLSGGHLRLTLSHAGSPERQAIWFSPKIAPETLDAIQAGEPFDLLAQASWNHFRGRQTFQLMVEDLRLASPPLA